MFTAGVVTALVVRTAEAMLQSPLNPLHSETLVDDDALAAVPPIITVSSAEMTALPAVTMPELPDLADDERINVLVMGIDRRPGSPLFAYRYHDAPFYRSRCRNGVNVVDSA